MESAAAQTVVDETQTRQRNLLLIQLAIQQTFDQLEMIVQESELLRMKLAADTQQHTADKSRHQDDDEMRLDSARGSRLPQSGPLLSSKGKVLRPFVITSNREEMVRNVFRPSHRLPTMSIDEFLKQEYERGNILQGGTDGPKADKLADGHDIVCY
jgi:hypothetical protein